MSRYSRSNFQSTYRCSCYSRQSMYRNSLGMCRCRYLCSYLHTFRCSPGRCWYIQTCKNLRKFLSSLGKCRCRSLHRCLCRYQYSLGNNQCMYLNKSLRRSLDTCRYRCWSSLGRCQCRFLRKCLCKSRYKNRCSYPYMFQNKTLRSWSMWNSTRKCIIQYKMQNSRCRKKAVSFSEALQCVWRLHPF